MGKLRRKYKSLKRYIQISEVLVKYGFSFVAEKLQEKGYIPRFVLRIDPLKEQASQGERLRRACEELGPTFIKLGQIISTRRDIIPEEIINELSKLQDNVVPVAVEEVKKVFRLEMNTEIEDAFAYFNENPIASASIGQVYEARLHSGEAVVVKIQRPNIKYNIQRDIEILFDIAQLLDDHSDKKKPYRLVEIVQEFSYAILKELDYSMEAKNTENFKENFKSDSHIEIPSIFWKYTSNKVITMERIYGIKIMDIDELNKQKWDLERLARIGAKSFMRQVFIHGFFHGDPHPGNIFAVSSSKIAFIDFGIVGYLDKSTMEHIRRMFTAAASKDVDKVVDVLKDMDAISNETNIRRLKEEMSFLINFYYNMPLKKMHLSDVVKQFMAVAYENQVKLPSQFAMLLKAIITVEGSGKLLYPNFTLSMIVKDSIKEIYLHRLKPENMIKEARDYTDEILYGIKYLPKQIRSLLARVEKNEIVFKFDQTGFKIIERELMRLTNKISLSLITSALIVASSLIIQSNMGPLLWGVPVFGLIGYVLSSILGVGIITTILYNIWKQE
ncbi:ABC-1 domain protein [Alkaliphilus metalliredigens QYMF]|uniref:ABC-1 domain protein n=1 Tax=Alkaliphilus metalliredigens (strain QYMF) TaxID=293826 RepID=A6TQN6_ALKMQ|nr:AarF/ABC1/UbiB kinase family protein [Alkaliphilus metalliredigens]ABR48504.1 ABC-1 domain protein [Alkaliphilus metalliredigens QYMF]